MSFESGETDNPETMSAGGFVESDDSSGKEFHEPEREDMMIDGRLLKKTDKIFNLVGVIEHNGQKPSSAVDEIMEQQIIETVERIARELFPAVAERVIREEIEKLREP
ncbi:MAG: hypothetical protein JW884_05740 [Deltaproteobacteria bacterium]|nr:hypothetical protein [Deltaproteobacteria bacterium]